MRLVLLSGLFAAVVIAANFMAVKAVDVLCFTLPAAVLCYPFSFVLGDLVTEFYGFRTTRKIVLLTFLLNALAIGFLALAAVLPPSRRFANDAAFRGVFLAAPRILAASFTAFVLSGLLNSWLFDLVKRRGFPLLARSAASTFCGVVVDSALFIPLAFYGVFPARVLLLSIAGHILAKVVLGIGAGSPLTWCVVKWAAKKNVAG